MSHANDPAHDERAPASDGTGAGDPPRPSAADNVIERIARACNVPREAVECEFWNTWEALLADAKFRDYVLVLAEKRVMESFRRKRR